MEDWVYLFLTIKRPYWKLNPSFDQSGSLIPLALAGGKVGNGWQEMGVISVSGVSHRFGATGALSSVDLKIERGERVALIGASGCGKTTLLRLMGMQLKALEGKVSVLGGEIGEVKSGELRTIRSKIGMLPQDLGLVENLRVVQNVILGRSGRCGLAGTLRDLWWPRRRDREEIFELLERVGVAEKMYDRTDSLSGGQQQRVALARLFYQEAEVLLADEPLSAVDPARGRDVLERLTGMAGEKGATLVASLHQLELAKEFFPRLIGLKKGKVVFDGQADDRELAALYEL